MRSYEDRVAITHPSILNLSLGTRSVASWPVSKKSKKDWWSKLVSEKVPDGNSAEIPT
jgi:hypothetical protein